MCKMLCYFFYNVMYCELQISFLMYIFFKLGMYKEKKYKQITFEKKCVFLWGGEGGG